MYKNIYFFKKLKFKKFHTNSQKTSNTHTVDGNFFQEAVYCRYQHEHFKKHLYNPLL